MSEPERTGNRLLDICIATLLGAMALYGAVTIIAAIWKPLCLVMAVIGSATAIVWILAGRFRRW